MNRRNFVATAGTAVTGSVLASSATMASPTAKAQKKRIALVGTGIRGITFWGKRLTDQYGDILEFVGLCDINPGRVEYGKKFIGAKCPTFTDFTEMMNTVKPELVIVTTVDATHHEFIIKGLDMGADVITEKPLTTDEHKCRRILEAEKKTGRKVIVGFNYRYNPHHTKLRELIKEERVGKITSVDFNWILNTYHGASYFRRWHGEKNKGGSLWVHKATHHFDLLNWWLDSDPVEVTAYGKLEHYGANNPYRGNKCRTCPHKEKCEYFYDITKDKTYMDLYVANEEYDGYIRDNCLWRHEIDIYDKMSAQIIYANGVTVNYSLTTYSPYEGMRISFNGHKGRLDAWHGIPWRKEEKLSQAELHKKEMSQDGEGSANYEEIMIGDNFKGVELLKVFGEKGGHGGGDKRLHDKIFRNPDMPDPLRHAAGTRDGAMSILVGIAARTSIEQNRTVRIEELTDIKPHPTRGHV